MSPEEFFLLVESAGGIIRYPGASVDCGEFRRKEYCLDKPTLMIEVASRSAGQFDDVDRVDEYKAIHSMQYIVLVETDRHYVRFYSRLNEDKWKKQVIIGMKSSIKLPQIGITITLEDLYSGLELRQANGNGDLPNIR